LIDSTRLSRPDTVQKIGRAIGRKHLLLAHVATLFTEALGQPLGTLKAPPSRRPVYCSGGATKCGRWPQFRRPRKK
jgi:hypothetical protein